MAQQKILLTILPVFYPMMPPLGLSYLESFLIEKGIHADILDINNIFYNLASGSLKKDWSISCNSALEKNILSLLEKDFPEKFDDVINKLLSCDIIGFSCFKSNFSSTIKIIKFIRSKKPLTKIILGGPEIARLFFKYNGSFPEEIKNLVDHIVVGEGELSLFDLIKGPDNATNETSCFKELKCLDDASFPKYRSIDISSYPKKTISLLLSRGCIKKCSFCSERLLYKRFRARSIESLMDEVEYHKLHNKIARNFVFNDSMINADLGKLDGLSEEIIRNFRSIPWEAQICIRKDMPKELFEKIKKSGCYNLFVGLESGCDRTLLNMNKGFTTSDAVIFFKDLQDAGLRFGISMITGYPGETEKDFEESLEFLIKNKTLIPKIEQINPFTYYEGTPLKKSSGNSTNGIAIKRYEYFVSEIKRHGFKYTNAFLGNLIEK
ncbi:MAG: radical SAM protein [Candidatus Omnitrophota bacterium]